MIAEHLENIRPDCVMIAEQFSVALVQTRVAADRETNLSRAVERVRAAASAGANVVVFPELFLGPYFCQSEDHARFALAESIPGPSTEVLGRAAREAGVVVVASLFERRAPGLYHNTAAVFDTDGSLVGIYRKMHIPDDPLYYEKFYFTPGDLGFRVFPTQFARVGVLICWDQWYPEGARLTAMRGAELLVYPTAIGWHPSEKAEHGPAQHEAWELMQRSHALANGVYVAAVNRVGHEGPDGGGLEFWGASFVSDPFGRVVGRASHDGEELRVVTCSRRLMEEVRQHWPFWRDRRTDAYDGLTRRWLES